MALPIKPERFREWSRLCADSLGAACAEIDAINVFPVPDGDTGTNAYFTFRAADDAVAELPEDALLGTVLRTYSEALLVNARGNCGTILAELVRGSLRVLRDHGSITPVSVEAAFKAAADAAFAAVGDPREGTILSVAAAAARGAYEAHRDGARSRDVFDQAAQAARRALADTPMQMDLLARTGVVDAGGMALVVVLDATAQVLTGRAPAPVAMRVEISSALLDAPVADELSADGPAYEVMYLLRGDDDRIPALRHTLSELGDSLVVVGGEGLWNVHVHVNDVGAAIEAGLAVGTPFRIHVTHFADQIAAQRTAAEGAAKQRSGRTVITAVIGEGLAELSRECGAIPLSFDVNQPLSLSTMSQAINEAAATGVAEILILPNRESHIQQFEAAARPVRDLGVRVVVLPTTAQVQGIAALAVYDEVAEFDAVSVSMSTAAAHTRHGAVTVATSDGITMAGPVKAGQILGVVHGDFAFVGDDVEAVALDVLTALDLKTAELVTIVRGAECPRESVEALEAHVAAVAAHVDVIGYDGGQQHYTLLLAVE